MTLPGEKEPTRKEMFERRMFMLGITELAKVLELWAIEQAKIAAAQPKGKKRKDRRNRRGSNT